MMALSVLSDLRLMVARGVHVAPSSNECSITKDAAEFSSPTSNSSSSCKNGFEVVYKRFAPSTLS